MARRAQGGGARRAAIGSGWANQVRRDRYGGEVASLLSRPRGILGAAPKRPLKRRKEFAQTFAGGSSAASGSETVNRAPPRLARSATTLPSWATATARTIESPSPVPVPFAPLVSA